MCLLRCQSLLFGAVNERIKARVAVQRSKVGLLLYLQIRVRIESTVDCFSNERKRFIMAILERRQACEVVD